jgi:DNA-binding FrmR family transcriptional regulator
VSVEFDNSAASAELQNDLLRRLRRIEGQTRGLQGMIAGERSCEEVLQQVAAVEAALRQVAVRLARAHLEQAIELDGPAGEANRDALHALESFVR